MKKRAFFHNLMVLMLALLIPVYLAAHTALKYYEEALQKREIAAAETELMLLSSSTDNMLYMCGGIASQIKNDSQLLHWLGQLKPQQMTYSALYPMFKTWEGYTQPLINCGNADSIYLYLDGLGVVLSTDGVRHLSTMRDTSWQQIYADNKERLLSADFLTCARSLPDGNKTVSCFTPLVNAQGICRGILVINISSRFLDVQTHHSTYANASLFLLNDTNEQFHSSDGRLLENLFDRDSILSLSDGGMAELQSADGEMYLVIAQRSEQFDWRFYQILKETDLFATLSDLRRIFAYILGTAFLVSIGFALFYTIQTYRPVMTMMHIIDSYNETGMVQYPSKKHSDLYDHIIYGLIHTLIEKNTMRIRVAELELAEKEAQLHAIQNRINPHFLYNSLDVVNWMVIRRLGPSNEISHAIRGRAWRICRTASIWISPVPAGAKQDFVLVAQV